MTCLLRRVALIAVIALFQFQLDLYSKAPRTHETEGLVYASFPGQPIPARSLLDVLVIQGHWGDGEYGVGNQQHWKLQFDKVDDQITPKGTFARYRVFAEGAPANKVYSWQTYSWQSWPFGQHPVIEPGDLYVNERGLLMTHRPQPDEEFSLRAPGGEFYITPQADPAVPLRYAIASLDKQLAILGTLVPQPVAAEDQGCRLEVRIAQPNAEAVLFIADGFPMESRIPLVLESEGETANLTMATDSGGHAIAAAFPYVQGKTQGILKATAEGPDCLPSVSLPWGPETHPAPEVHPAQKKP